ncbi:uncharacterized protein LOC131222957 [Magnolia sinica]|uniref:uncharacterized protein LOC131222957 n=1 Tax=Magnolia sinica TaxID=86752 RepID=UPI00265AE4A8|nr:uncharacterized protein LOC131222957 [Magnolia sinica]
MEASPPVAKRLWNIVRIVYYMLRKGISKRKLMVDLHLMMKRGKIAGKKAIGNLMFHHHPAFICNSNDGHVSFAPREYEFSCSNSPAYPSFPFHVSKRKNHHHYSSYNRRYDGDDVAARSAFQKTMETPSSDISEAMSPMPGFGKGAAVRQLRITDSPFPIKDAADEDSHVDREAEEFIRRFYEQLRLQKRMAALEARYQEMMMAG